MYRLLLAMETKSKDSSSTLCSLCGREGQYTISFSSLNEEERSFIEGHHEERKKVIQKERQIMKS